MFYITQTTELKMGAIDDYLEAIRLNTSDICAAVQEQTDKNLELSSRLGKVLAERDLFRSQLIEARSVATDLIDERNVLRDEVKVLEERLANQKSKSLRLWFDVEYVMNMSFWDYLLLGRQFLKDAYNEYARGDNGQETCGCGTECLYPSESTPELLP